MNKQLLNLLSQRQKSKAMDSVMGPRDNTAPASEADIQDALELGPEAGGLSQEEAKMIRENQSEESGIKDMTDDAGRAELFDEIQQIKSDKESAMSGLQGVGSAVAKLGAGPKMKPIKMQAIDTGQPDSQMEEFEARRRALMSLAGRQR